MAADLGLGAVTLVEAGASPPKSIDPEVERDSEFSETT